MTAWSERADLPWVKVFAEWFTSPSHVDLDVVTLGIGVRCMQLANQRGRQPDGSGWLVNGAGAPMSLAALAREAHATPAQVERALKDLVAVGTLEMRGQVVVFPNLQRWQEDPSTERQRRRRGVTPGVNVTPLVTLDVTPDRVTGSVNVTPDVTLDVTPDRVTGSVNVTPDVTTRGSEDQRIRRSEEKRKEEEKAEEEDIASSGSSPPLAEPTGGDLDQLQLVSDPAAGAPVPASRAAVDRVVEAYRRHHPQARPGERERKLIRARLAEGYSVEQLARAIDGNNASPWHRGENDKGRPYQALELVMRNSDKVAQFIALAAEHCDTQGRARAAPVLTERTRRNVRAAEAWLAEEEDRSARP